MSKHILVVALVATASLSAQEHKHVSCTVPEEARESVNRYLDLSLGAAKQIERDYPRSGRMAEVAMGKVCLGDFKAAAQISDLAYPSGSASANALGYAVAESGRLEEVPALESEMKHGTDSFLAGLALGSAEAGKFAEADFWAKKIPSAEVQSDAQAGIMTALYKAGHEQEAMQRAKTGIVQHQGGKSEASPAELELDLAVAQRNWQAVHAALDRLPDGVEKRYMAAMIAAEESEAGAPDAEKDLLAYVGGFSSKVDPPYEGYVIAAHLAGMKNFTAAMKAAEAVRDDEWNRKCWSSIALFQAEEGKLADAKASIAKIGTGTLEHALGDAPEGRDMARIFVAEGLSTGGHAEAALSLLDDREDMEDYTDRHFLPARVQALATEGDFVQARALVNKEIAKAVVIDDEIESMAEYLVTNWYSKEPGAAEEWVSAQKLPEIQATCWSALASAAMRQKPEVRHYFVNWD